MQVLYYQDFESGSQRAEAALLNSGPSGYLRVLIDQRKGPPR